MRQVRTWLAAKSTSNQDIDLDETLALVGMLRAVWGGATEGRKRGGGGGATQCRGDWGWAGRRGHEVHRAALGFTECWFRFMALILNLSQ